MMLLLLFAPLFLSFEIWQLVVCERYMGVKQLAAGNNPRTLPMPERMAMLWVFSLCTYWIWMGLLFSVPFARAQALCLFGVSLAGYFLRRNTSLKWALVILTFEGAIRIGMLISLCAALWRRLPAL